MVVVDSSPESTPQRQHGSDAEDQTAHGQDGRWIFEEEALARAREVAHERAAAALRSSVYVRSTITATALIRGAEKLRVALSPGGRAIDRSAHEPFCEAIRPLDFEGGQRLVFYYAKMFPELCRLIGAPSEVCWTAIVLFQRFFATNSPMEYDPCVVMYTCVFLSSKIEECHDITLDRMLEVAYSGVDSTMRAKVVGLELTILESVGFALLIEPKPDSALAMLFREVKPHLPGPLAEDEAVGKALLASAERLAIECAVRTDAVLCWPPSLLIVAALVEAIDEQLATDSDREAAVVALGSILVSASGSEGEPEQEAALRQMLLRARAVLRSASAEAAADTEIGERLAGDAAIRKVMNAVFPCHRAFDLLRDEAGERHEAHRLERKRRWSEIKGKAALGGGRRQVPTPFTQGLAELDRHTAALRFDSAGVEDFVIHSIFEHRNDDL
mmetsp:Transcript_73634/g.204687  ORF Transcript_73634/g.204687 Transcript_73634/m.204687 type:complete len:444 (+) Transcript_73634:85-1416(+)|eukprot:CAMPEP_0117537504 /NCGR_PEP_ID=MMETSP0784-20121206/41998_1 /TAXON_ID=39447 /ORGANISM="" /LENGTH=443 /DNA_ID=CAMNT_0005334091 /DNA_START=79 /DNA_END=1410 /DNA_ORIENTATION=+